MRLNPTPFQIPAPSYLRWLAQMGECLLGLSQLDTYYRERNKNMSTLEFLRYTLSSLGVEYSIDSGDFGNIPKHGPSIVVANHPFGAIEGVLLSELLLKHRQDVKVLANEYLHRIDEISDLFIGVDVFENTSTTLANMQGIKQAINHLKSGGLLLIFPAGEVSSLQITQARITDKHWNRIIAMLVRKTSANTTPIYIEGKNSKIFHLAGVLHPRLRTLLLVREMLNKRKKIIKLHIGQNISYSELSSLSSDEAMTYYLRMNTYLLSGQVKNRYGIEKNKPLHMDPIALPVSKHLLQQDINALSSKHLLLNKDNLSVYCVCAQNIPHILDEIGRLREITFRLVSEGTGKSYDLDDYDKHYLHMFIWNHDSQEAIGAYRLGLVNKLLKKSGISALYTRSLFQYDKAFIESMGNSIEMGRSFIRHEYQRSITSLLMLWKGIASFASRNPKYTTLFGPVSISSDYSETSRSLMAGFLQLHHYDNHMAKMVRAYNPHKNSSGAFWSKHMLKNINDNQLISKLIYRMEGNKGLPILLKQYLGLNGKLVCFNVDKNFNNSLDGMIIVDLLKVPEKALAKYMGKTQANHYLNR